MVEHTSTIITISKALIAPAYLMIAALLYVGAGSALWTTKPGRAVMALVAVFILCDNASYISFLMGMPLRVVEAAHVLLVIAAWAFIFMRQSTVIAKALRDD